MSWTPGDVSGSEVLTPQDHLYETHVNELREAVDGKVSKVGDSITVPNSGNRVGLDITQNDTTSSVANTLGLRITNNANSVSLRNTSNGTGTNAVFDSNATNAVGVIVRNQTAVRTGVNAASLFAVQNNAATGTGTTVGIVNSAKATSKSLTVDTDALVVSNGKVGVNKATPEATLDVGGDIAGTLIKLTTGAGAGKLLTSDASGNATWIEPIFATVGATTGNFPVSGYSDASVAIKAAVDYVGAAGGREIVILPGTFNCPTPINIDWPNITIRGSGMGATKLRASAAYAGTYDAIFKVNATVAGTENIVISDIELDCNNQTNAKAIVLDGFGVGRYIRGVTIERVRMKGGATTASGLLNVVSGAALTRGDVSKITLRNIEFRDTFGNHSYFLGNNISHVLFEQCDFQSAYQSCIKVYQYNKTDNDNVSQRSNLNWEVTQCYFYNNNLEETDHVNGPSYSIIDDNHRTGIWGFRIHHNTFEGDGEYTFASFAINVHRTWNLEVTNNFFKKTSRCLSIGEQQKSIVGLQSHAASMTMIKDNFFYKCNTLSDHDSEIFAQWEGNTFYELRRTPGFGGYARHWPSVWRNNFIYNTPCEWDTPDGTRIFELAIFQPSQNGWILENNTIIDDRRLPTPTSAPSGSTVVSGGALGSRTYYVKYTYVNDTGQTLPSPQTTVVVGANQLLKFVEPTSLLNTTIGSLTGVKRVNVYVGTVSGSETLQGYIEVGNHTELETDEVVNTLTWTEPATGLVAGAALPVANTTQTFCKYGIWEGGGDSGLHQKNVYANNRFYGIENPIVYDVARSVTDGAMTSGSKTLTSASGQFGKDAKGKVITVSGAGSAGGLLTSIVDFWVSPTELTLANAASTSVTGSTVTWGKDTTTRIAYKNIVSSTITAGDDEILEEMLVNKGNVSGAFTIYPTDGGYLQFTLTGNSTPTIKSGSYKGQKLKVRYVQDATGSRTLSKPANVRYPGGSLTLSTGANAVDEVDYTWDNTYWNGSPAALNLS